MAVIHLVDRAIKYTTKGSSVSKPWKSASHAINYGGLSAGLIITIIIILFIGSYIYFYYKAKKEFKKTGKPISHAKIFVKALLVALIVGIILEIISACTGGGGGDDNQYQDVANPQGTEYLGAGGAPVFEVPQAPMPTMDGNGFWTPVQNAASDPVV